MPLSDRALGYFLSTLSLKRTDREQRRFVVVPEQRLTRGGAVSIEPAVKLYHLPGSLNHTQVRADLAARLRARGHLADEQVAGVLLALYARVDGRHDPGQALALFNRLFDCLVPAKVSRWMLLNIILVDVPAISLGGFSLGPLDRRDLYQKARSLGCKLEPVYYKTLLDRQYNIERAAVDAVVVDIVRLCKEFWVSDVDAGPLLDDYYQLLSAVWFDDFYAELRLLQVLPMALGSAWIEVERLQELTHTSRFCLFHCINGDKTMGHGTPLALGSALLSMGAHEGLAAMQQVLADPFAYAVDADSELHGQLRRYAEFLAVAKERRAVGRPEEALLHLVIGLDMLLIGPNDTSACLKQRAALLTYTAAGCSFAEQLRRCATVYQARCDYVHQGKSVDEQTVDDAEGIAREILLCLLRRARDGGAATGEFLRPWWHAIDQFAGLAERAVPLAPEQLRAVGAAGPDDFAYRQVSDRLHGRLTEVAP